MLHRDLGREAIVRPPAVPTGRRAGHVTGRMSASCIVPGKGQAARIVSSNAHRQNRFTHPTGFSFPSAILLCFRTVRASESSCSSAVVELMRHNIIVAGHCCPASPV